YLFELGDGLADLGGRHRRREPGLHRARELGEILDGEEAVPAVGELLERVLRPPGPGIAAARLVGVDQDVGINQDPGHSAPLASPASPCPCRSPRASRRRTPARAGPDRPPPQGPSAAPAPWQCRTRRRDSSPLARRGSATRTARGSRTRTRDASSIRAARRTSRRPAPEPGL